MFGFNFKWKLILRIYASLKKNFLAKYWAKSKKVGISNIGWQIFEFKNI